MTWLQRLTAMHVASDQVAVEAMSGPVTGRAFAGKVVVAAEFLAGLGVAECGRLPALLSTNVDALALVVGGAAANRPLAPLGPALAVPELASMVARCGCPVLLSESQYLPGARQVAALAEVRLVTVPSLPSSASHVGGPGGQVAFFLHTAGTTGAPKCVAFTQEVLAARTGILSALFGFGPAVRYATGSPLHHVGGLGNTIAALSAGATVLPTAKFSIQWWLGLRGLGVTHCLLVPAMISMLLAEGVLGTIGIQTLIYGGSPLARETLQRVLQVLPGTRLFNLYGQTEGSPITCLDAQDHMRAAAGEHRLLNSAGRAVPGLRMRIDRPDAFGLGEVLATAEHLAARDPDGWLRTGDLGRIDDNGYLFLSGRQHDKIIRGGENIYPVEVEDVLVKHDGVRDAGVVGVPDQRLGETVAAFVVPRDPGSRPSAEELRSFVRTRLAGFKVPVYWYTVDELPYNSAGKLMRHSLRNYARQNL
jgi:acyl-CoA synthetase (AMP-forming)/AMP-acid ligase II